MQLYDGVTLPAEGSLPSMTGVIVYKKDETIGIRLTGESEGMGDHCGDVDGVQYFDGGVNSGVMTTLNKVEGPRKLTFNEESLIRSLLQPKPAHSTPMASSIPMSGLSPAAIARMMQLNQRMGVPTPTSAASTPSRNKLPPSTAPPGASSSSSSSSPGTPQLSDPPTVTTNKEDKSSGEPALEEEKPAEKRLSRLEILRQKKEAIRKRKLELSKKVEITKKEKLQQQQQQQQEAPAAAKPQQEEPTANTMETEDTNNKASSSPKSSPKSVSSVKSTSSSSSKRMPPPPAVIRSNTDTSMQDDGVGSVKSKESSMLSKASRSSRDSIEQLWIDEVRHENPNVAARYDMEDAENLLLEEDEEDAPESTRSLHMEGILRQPELQHNNKNALQSSKSEGQEDDEEDDGEVEEEQEPGRKAPMRQSSLSRLQQLRQKKRLLEALPASIQAPPAVGPNVVFLEDMPQQTTSNTATTTNNNLATMAMASAAALGHSNHDNLATFPEASRAMVQDRTDDEEDDENDSKTTTSALSDMEDDKHHHHQHQIMHDDAVPAAFQESVTITAESTNPLPAGEETSSNHHKRRRMLGLGFLPGVNREQKRQKNSGTGGHGQ